MAPGSRSMWRSGGGWSDGGSRTIGDPHKVRQPSFEQDDAWVSTWWSGASGQRCEKQHWNHVDSPRSVGWRADRKKQQAAGYPEVAETLDEQGGENRAQRQENTCKDDPPSRISIQIPDCPPGDQRADYRPQAGPNPDPSERRRLCAVYSGSSGCIGSGHFEPVPSASRPS
jgi:hypothetical protein